jgi:hypothetical protein
MRPQCFRPLAESRGILEARELGCEDCDIRSLASDSGQVLFVNTPTADTGQSRANLNQRVGARRPNPFTSSAPLPLAFCFWGINE